MRRKTASYKIVYSYIKIMYAATVLKLKYFYILKKPQFLKSQFLQLNIKKNVQV